MIENKIGAIKEPLILKDMQGDVSHTFAEGGEQHGSKNEFYTQELII